MAEITQSYNSAKEIAPHNLRPLKIPLKQHLPIIRRHVKHPGDEAMQLVSIGINNKSNLPNCSNAL